MQLLSESSFVIRMVANITMTLYSCLGPCTFACIHHLLLNWSQFALLTYWKPLPCTKLMFIRLERL